MSISALTSTPPAAYTPPTPPAASANAKAPDGDYSTRGAGRVKDSGGDYKPITSASPPPLSSAVQQALSNLKTGG
ncbi:MAG: hypothetical protein ACLPSF_06060 [Methylocella sp.]